MSISDTLDIILIVIITLCAFIHGCPFCLRERRESETRRRLF